MRRFYLNRSVDVSGVSGTGRICEGVEWHDGKVHVSWLGRYHSTESWPCIEECMKVHGHGGLTTLEWIDDMERPHDEMWHDAHV